MVPEGPEEYPVSPWQTVALVAACVLVVVVAGVAIVAAFQLLLT
jgi:hypothetical protein